jgi:hypothetical protein
MRTKDKPFMSKLSYAQTDPLANLVQDVAFPPMNSITEEGKYREIEARAHYLEIDAERISKHSVGQTYDYTDAFRYFKNDPVGANFKFSRADLDNPQQRGYTSAAQMIEAKRAWLTKLLKKKKEKSMYTVITTDANYESSSYYNNAATAWSSTGTANPLDDIAAGRLVVPEINAGIMSWTAFQYLQRNQTLSSMTTVTGSMRDGSVNPTITTEFVKNVFQLDYLWIARGSLITDSSDATDETRTEIWGDTMFLFFHNPTPGPEEPAAIKHLFWPIMGKGAGTAGWFVTETTEDRSGGVGSVTYDIWNYHQFLVQEPTLMYRIDALY